MIRRIRIIGIGMGSPGQVTREAADAIASVDVFLVADKGADKADLVAARQAICTELVPVDHPYRVVEVPDPQRGADATRSSAAYDRGVRDWHAARVEAYATVIEGLADGEETVGFLVWGDPAFYDSTIRVVDALIARWAQRGILVEHDVLPGISAPQLLAARHRIPLNRIGAPIHITTGRRLLDEYASSLGDVVVMLVATGLMAAPRRSSLELAGFKVGPDYRTFGADRGAVADREEVRAVVARGVPTVAECAGLLHLSRSVDGHQMVGAVPATATMGPRLTLGYPEAVAPAGSVLGAGGTRASGHEFHRTTVTATAESALSALGMADQPPAWLLDGRPDGFALDPAGTGRATLHASYLHVHWAGHPVLAQAFCAGVHAYADARSHEATGVSG